MEILVNGQTRSVPMGATAAELIDLLELGGRRIAVEVNGRIVPRSAFAEQRLSPGDRVEIVQAVGGG